MNLARAEEYASRRAGAVPPVIAVLSPTTGKLNPARIRCSVFAATSTSKSAVCTGAPNAPSIGAFSWFAVTVKPNAFQIASESFTNDKLVTLAKRVSALAKDPSVNGIVVTEIGAVTVRFLLHDRDPEAAAKRMEGWRTKLRELLSDNLTLNGTLQGSIVDWDFTEFSTFGRDGAPPYGFDLEIRIPLGLVASVARGA